MQLITSLAAAAAIVQFVSATGSAMIQNNCNVPVYMWAVDAQRNPGAPTIIAPGSSYTEAYHTPSTGGVSLKLSKTSTLDNTKVTQLEYTLAGGFIWYDGSNVNCQGANCPFYNDGIYMDTSSASCPTRTCTPGVECTGFYNLFNDDINSLSCDPSSSVNFYLCSQSASGPAAPAASSQAAPVPAPAPAAAAPSVAPPAVSQAPPAAPSVWKMEAPQGMPTTLVKRSAKETPVARDLHNHMRRHNHMHQ